MCSLDVFKATLNCSSKWTRFRFDCTHESGSEQIKQSSNLKAEMVLYSGHEIHNTAKLSVIHVLPLCFYLFALDCFFLPRFFFFTAPFCSQTELQRAAVCRVRDGGSRKRRTTDRIKMVICEVRDRVEELRLMITLPDGAGQVALEVVRLEITFS